MTLRFTAVIFLILTLIAGSVSAQQSRPSLFLSGNVKSVQEKLYSHAVRYGKQKKVRYIWKKDRYYNIKTLFNLNGSKAEVIEYTRRNSVYLRTVYKYDSAGLVRNIINFNSNNIVVDSTTYHNYFDTLGRLNKRVTWFSKDNHCRIYLYEYHSDGEIHEFELHRSEQKEEKELIRVYDAEWRVKTEYTYDGRGRIWFKENVTYNSRGQLTSDSMFHKNRTAPVWTEHCTYDSMYYVHSSEICKKPFRRLTRTWTYEYKFDSQGNWVECTEYRNGNPVFIRERTITYY